MNTTNIAVSRNDAENRTESLSFITNPIVNVENVAKNQTKGSFGQIQRETPRLSNKIYFNQESHMNEEGNRNKYLIKSSIMDQHRIETTNEIPGNTRRQHFPSTLTAGRGRSIFPAHDPSTRIPTQNIVFPLQEDPFPIREEPSFLTRSLSNTTNSFPDVPTNRVKRYLNGRGVIISEVNSGNGLVSIYSKDFGFSCLQNLSKMRNSHVAIGDWIKFDAEELDPGDEWRILRYDKIEPQYPTFGIHNSVVINFCPVYIPAYANPNTRINSEISESVYDNYHLIKDYHLENRVLANLSYKNDFPSVEPSGYWCIELIHASN